MTELTRVQKHKIKNSDRYFSLIYDFCVKSKNLYNHANYLVRQKFVESGEWLRYQELDTILKRDLEFCDYKNMPTAQSAQQTLRLLDNNWKSFFKSIKDWNNNKDKYLGRPKLPKYLNKYGAYVLIITNQNCKLANNCIKFPKVFDNFTITTDIHLKSNFISLQQVRFIPHRTYIVSEVVYTISVNPILSDNNRYVGVDIGVDNLATIANNCNLQPFIINGRPLKSINQFYNKQISHFREVCKRINKSDYSKFMDKLTIKRNSKIDDYMHKASRKIIDFCICHGINTIIIGKNNNWKQRSKLSKKVNQNFIQIPFARFINMIQYKAEELGITVILTEESYTSGTSFIDNELPTKEYYNKSRRIHRGLFRSNNNILINADLNGAYQIIKKVVPIKWDRGCVLHPVVVGIS